jgi:hypothetical protein
MLPRCKTSLLRFALILLLLRCLNCAVFAADKNGSANSGKTQFFYVAPQKAGDGKGKTAATPADFRDTHFWSVVQQAVQNGPTVVNFLDGTYTVSADKKKSMPTFALADLGSEKYPLTLQGISEHGVVFTRLASDTLDGQKGPGLFQVTHSRNLVIRGLHFTGKQPMGYATRFDGKDILIEHCSWIDLPRVLYGATGTSYSTDHVTFCNCEFKRIGTRASAHMAYNAYGPQHIAFINCWFEDGAGDYVRFRDRADYGVVVGCTFKSTGNYLEDNMPFISVPLFNDDDPQNAGSSPNYEYFGTHFLIFNNDFIYSNDKRDGVRVAILFHHSGFDPPGRSHLLTLRQAELLRDGSTAAKKSFLWDHCRIDADSIHFFNNRFIDVDLKVAYRSHAAYGAKSKGWDGIIDISDVVNSRNVVDSGAQALTFFK